MKGRTETIAFALVVDQKVHYMGYRTFTPKCELPIVIWVWLKVTELGLRRFQSLVPFTKVPWYMSSAIEPTSCTLEAKPRLIPNNFSDFAFALV